MGYRQFGIACRRRVWNLKQRMDVSRPAVDLAGSQAGGLDTAWFAYNNFFNGAGHVFAGKLEVPAPSEFSQWLDVCGLSVNSQAEITVGEHAYQLDANRWGYKFGYMPGSLDAEIAYVTSGADWAGFNDYDSTQDKTLQYKLAFANRGNPLEFGYYGARGSWPLTEVDSISITVTDSTRSAIR